jgi:thiol-disulfide isomerase/thioredoxin
MQKIVKALLMLTVLPLMALDQGNYRLNLEIQGKLLPFILQKTKNDVFILNSTEKIKLKESDEANTYIIPIYENKLVIQSIKDGALSGIWIKADQSFTFNGKKVNGTKRFDEVHRLKVAPKWKLDFIDDNGKFEKNAIAVFENKGDVLTGSILTETGDYRYLEGHADKNKIYLYGLDGQFAFIFEGTITSKNSLELVVYSGKTWNRKITGVVDEKFKLQDPENLTKLKTKSVIFSFKDIAGKTISEKDFRGKPFIIQIFGSWCPNCLDETRFLTDWLKTNNIAVLALAFEKANSKKHANYLVDKMKKNTGAPYQFAVASFDLAKKGVLDSLSFLENHVSFPTLIFVNKKSQVQMIHTGFSGPATGQAYQQFKLKFEDYIKEII